MSRAINLLAIAAGTVLLAAAPAKTLVLTESGSAKVGAMAPSFGGWDLSGKQVISLDKLLKEQPPTALLITFGASWCLPCNEGFPRLMALQQKHQEVLRLLLVDVEPGQAKAQEFAARHGFSGPAILDKFEVTAKTYGLHEQGKLALPRTFLLTAKGRVQAIYREDGADIEELIEADLKAALAHPEGPAAAEPAK
jgi:thiol-disulfide isomerase/thioredoxin